MYCRAKEQELFRSLDQRDKYYFIFFLFLSIKKEDSNLMVSQIKANQSPEGYSLFKKYFYILRQLL